MTMTRTILSIQFVLILATVIGTHGEETLHEAALNVMSNFEDGLSDKEFRVDFAGVVGSQSATIKIFKKDEGEPTFKYEIKDGADKAKTFYFLLDDASAGSYQVQVCYSGKCTPKRAAIGQVTEEEDKPTLSCIKGKGEEENVFYRFVNDEDTKDFHVTINPGKSFLTKTDYDAMPEFVKERSGYKKLEISVNPAYKKVNNKNVFYAAVMYDGRHLRDLVDTAVSNSEKIALYKKYNVNRKLITDEHTHAYCSRKYLFWASVRVVDKQTKAVLRRFRGTVVSNEFIINNYILNPEATLIPVEFVRYDDEKLPEGTYAVSVSFCASDKDHINSSVCSAAVDSTLNVKDE